MILDDQMPAWDVRERHSIRVAASPERTLAAAREVTGREIPLLRGLMAVRTLGVSLRGRTDVPLLRGFERMGFAVVGASEDEVAYGSAGRFWRPSGGLLHLPPGEFAAFAEPGFAKAGFNFRVEAAPGGGCVLTTETRVLGTDPGARRRFRAYWTVVRPGSGLIRRDWLRAIRARAEG
ncbi:MAG: hypothetical protein JW895_03310 [Thermoleophilaceae bacterium]|nr:hypothetical protein [Thermoleophilaceae bacterium]